MLPRMTEIPPDSIPPPSWPPPWLVCGIYLAVLVTARAMGLQDGGALARIILGMLVIGACVGYGVSGAHGMFVVVTWWFVMTVCVVVAFVLLVPIMLVP